MKNQKPNLTTLLTLGGLLACGFGVQIYLFPRFINSADIMATHVETSAHAEGQKPKDGSYLTCAALRERTRDFVKVHYSVRKFDTEIAQRTFNKFFQLLDPGKNFFTQSDVDSFKPYETKLHENVGKVDCRFISEVYAVYLKRVQESALSLDVVLKTPFDYAVDESIETDRKKIPWAKNNDELRDRWRKLLKFTAMGMRETEPDWNKLTSRLKKRYALVRKSMTEKSMDDVNGIFLNAFALSLDPHSQYLMPEDQDEFKVAFSLQLVGIGASLTQQDGYTIVDSVIAGGAAARDGRLKKGDKITAVDSGDGNGFTDVVDMDLSKVVTLIRGKKDSHVKLILLRKDLNSEVARITLDLVRDVVRLQDGEAHSDVMQVNGKKIGVINLPSFYIDYQGSRSNADDFRSSSGDMAREIKRLTSQGVDGIVLDLRRNGGGDLSECVRITGQFIEKGSVVQIEGRGGDVESLDDRDSGTLYNGPLGVLISKQSASASEILAGAIQDYGRGLIMGNSRTYGKATVQNVMEVPGSKGRESDGAIKVTISKFYRPSGKSNQERGVPSDIVIPDILEVADISEAENDYVLPYTTIAQHKGFKPLQDFGPLLEGLRKKSEDRVKGAKEFKEIFENIEKAKKEKANTSLSLKIADKKPSKGQTKGTPTAGAIPTPSPTPTPDRDAQGNQVIRPDDSELAEAAQILVDSIQMLGPKSDWAH